MCNLEFSRFLYLSCARPSLASTQLSVANEGVLDMERELGKSHGHSHRACEERGEMK